MARLQGDEDLEVIEKCDDEDDVSSKPSILSAMPIYNTVWEPIILYRKELKKRQRGLSSTPRVLRRSGRGADLYRRHVPLRGVRYVRDLSNTVIHARWRWAFAAAVATITSLWLIFAWAWMLVSAVHDDLEYGITGRRNGSCTIGIQGFAGFLIMSIETQTTIGTGSMYPTENCPEGVFLVCLQMLLGIGIEGFIIGIFYVKMTRPKIRDCRNKFSKYAVVCQRDGNMCLMFRISDENRLHIVGTVIKAWLTEAKNEQDDYIEAYQTPLKLENPGLLLWPLIVVHKIDKNSPLYDMSARDLLLKRFEIIISIMGTCDSTGQLTQSRTSYLTSEIHWGYRFRSCVFFDEVKEIYTIHDDSFNSVVQVDTPLCSAKRLDEVLGELQVEENRVDSTPSTSGIGSLTCSIPVSERTDKNDAGRNGEGRKRKWNEGVIKLEEVLETNV